MVVVYRLPLTTYHQIVNKKTVNKKDKTETNTGGSLKREDSCCQYDKPKKLRARLCRVIEQEVEVKNDKLKIPVWLCRVAIQETSASRQQCFPLFLWNVDDAD